LWNFFFFFESANDFIKREKGESLAQGVLEAAPRQYKSGWRSKNKKNKPQPAKKKVEINKA
jgi:hypothetical protein